MPGLRVGYALGPEELISSMETIQQFTVACVNSSAQYAALATLEGPQDFIADMVREFDRRRQLLHSRLNEIESFWSTLPKGTFYMFPNIEGFGVPSEKFVEYLFNNGKVVAVPGSAFGNYYEGYLWFSYSTAYNKIEEALDLIEKTVKPFK